MSAMTVAQGPVWSFKNKQSQEKENVIYFGGREEEGGGPWLTGAVVVTQILWLPPFA